MTYTANDYLSHFIGRLNAQFQEAISGLNDEQLYHPVTEDGNHAVFLAWHWLRTEDNVLNFICQGRKAPLWLRQELHEKWNLPKVNQGTGWDTADAQALRVPSAGALSQYAKDLNEDVMPYLGGVSQDDLRRETAVAPWGDAPVIQHIGQTILAHGNGHLAQIYTIRSLLGLGGDPF